MSRPESRIARTRPTRVAAAVSAMIGAVALAGCGAGQITQTSEQVSAVAGANATAGTIAVRNAQFEFDTAAEGAAIYRTGESAPLQMVVVNTGGRADRLVSASSPVAGAVQITGDPSVPAGQSLLVEGMPAEPAAPAPTTGAVPSGAATTGAPSTGAPTTTGSPATGTGEEPTGTAAATPTATFPAAPTSTAGAPLGEGQARTASIVLTGLRQDLQVGPTYPVVLTFEKAGDVHVAIPVGNSDVPRKDEH